MNSSWKEEEEAGREKRKKLKSSMNPCFQERSVAKHWLVSRTKVGERSRTTVGERSRTTVGERSRTMVGERSRTMNPFNYILLNQ